MFENNDDDEYDSVLDRIKDHFDQYKTVYISVGVIALSIGVGIAIGKKIDVADTGQELIVKAKSISDSPIINNSTITQNNFQGHLSKIVRCIETGEIWDSITSAAEDLGVSRQNLVKAIHGERQIAENMHFEIIGLGSRS
jgi:hypothetical protein